MSFFALRPRELRQAPMPRADAAHLTRDDIGRLLIACTLALLLSGALVYFLLTLPEAQQDGAVTAPQWRSRLGSRFKSRSGCSR